MRIPQIGTFFRPLGGETGNSDESGVALGSHCPAKTKARFRDFFGSCEIFSPHISNPRVAGSSPAGRTLRRVRAWRPDARQPTKVGQAKRGTMPRLCVTMARWFESSQAKGTVSPTSVASARHVATGSIGHQTRLPCGRLVTRIETTGSPSHRASWCAGRSQGALQTAQTPPGSRR